jgi:sigma-B regulation protein RsbU (phosphoserine phosphatase)
VIRAGNRIERLEEGGAPLGMFPGTSYQQATVTLQPGDTFVCFSDGISEATNEREEIWDQERYLGLLKQTACLSAREIVDTLIGATDEFTGDAEQADDMTIVVLKIGSDSSG